MQEKRIESVEDLIVWQRSFDLVDDVYRLTRTFPKEELYGLTSQIRRAAVSIPANIAEGYGRFSGKDYSRFLAIAHGSARELETLLKLSVRVNVAKQDAIRPALARLEECRRMLWSLRQSISSNS
ncbi:MAG: four helix bundle protein [Planctomycetales bacterium]|nr:four helix bundle protein [bacterium]UNM08507.1 MAG: four helix bundle protein [Planctomycetales bacterium]